MTDAQSELPASVADPDGVSAFWRDAVIREVERNFNPTDK